MAAGGIRMIPTGARLYLRDQITVPGLTVLPFGVSGPFDPPALVIGQPDVTFAEWGCTNRVTIGLAVVARHHPEGAEATIRDLDTLWVTVAWRLLDVIRTDPTLGGFVTDTTLKSAQFGDFVVAGSEYPCQNLTIETYV